MTDPVRKDAGAWTAKDGWLVGGPPSRRRSVFVSNREAEVRRLLGQSPEGEGGRSGPAVLPWWTNPRRVIGYLLSSTRSG